MSILFHRYLIDHGADVAAVNNEGELPLDLAEEEDMEDLLTDEIERLGKSGVLNTPFLSSLCLCLKANPGANPFMKMRFTRMFICM